MATLGVPTRVTYQSSTLRSGLQDVSIIVERPDGSLLGMFQMTESPYARGIYTYDIVTTTSDQGGTYQCVVMSPTDGVTLIINKDIEAPLDLSLLQQLVSGLIPVNLSGKLETNSTVLGKVQPTQSIVGNFDVIKVTGQILDSTCIGVVSGDEALGQVDNSSIKGMIYDQLP